jgi:ammonium transporter Rh
MAMLLFGFGFLMVFVKKYGRSALTATFLLVSVSLPTYLAIKSLGIFGGLAAIVVVDGISVGSQLTGIAITVVLAVVAGLFSGKIISLFGKPDNIYNDAIEFEGVE